MIYIYQQGDTFSVTQLRSGKPIAPRQFRKCAPRIYENASAAYRVETFGRIRNVLELFGAQRSNPTCAGSLQWPHSLSSPSGTTYHCPDCARVFTRGQLQGRDEHMPAHFREVQT